MFTCPKAHITIAFIHVIWHHLVRKKKAATCTFISKNPENTYIIANLNKFQRTGKKGQGKKW